MGNFIPVEPEKWAEMVKALAEVERLKAEVERLTFDPMSYLDDQGEWMPRHTHLAAVERLKAEVERLTERNKFLEQIDSYLQGANENAYEKRCDELEAEVERLRKAGDWMCGLLRFDFVTKEWNAAKEGKQP